MPPKRRGVSRPPPASPAATRRPRCAAGGQVRTAAALALAQEGFPPPSQKHVAVSWGVKNRPAKHMQCPNSLPARWSALFPKSAGVNVQTRCCSQRRFCHLLPQETQSSATLPQPGSGGRPGPARGARSRRGEAAPARPVGFQPSHPGRAKPAVARPLPSRRAARGRRWQGGDR